MSDSEFEEFDPYRIWLSIPKAEQPPNHYRLLGVSQFESDARVIEEAADRQVAHLKTKQTSSRAALSQQLLSEVAAATAVLFDPQARAKYEQKLRAATAEKMKATAAKAAAAKTPPAPKTAAPQAVPMPQARPLPLQPQPLPQQAVYQQPIYQQPVYQQPAPQQPSYQQSHPQLQPLQSQPLRPIPVKPPAEPAPQSLGSIAIEGASLVGSGQNSSSSVRPRRKEKNPALEIAKVVIGGATGLAIGAMVLVSIGKSDFLYSLVGMQQPVVTQTPTKSRPGNSGNQSNKGWTYPGASNPSPNGSQGPASANSEAGSPTENEPANDPGATNSSSSSNDPAGSSSQPTNPPVDNGNSPASRTVPLPPFDVTTTQVASAAMREGMAFVHDTFANLATSLIRPENRAQAQEQLALMQRLQGNNSPVGPIPSSDSLLLNYRKQMISQLDPIDANHFNRGVWPNFSYKVLASMSIPSRPNSPEPQGQIHKLNSVDSFPQKLSDYADNVLTLAQTNRANAEAHDRLCYVASVAQVLKFSYLRGNTEQFSSCLLLDALTPEILSALSSETQRRRFTEVHLATLNAAGFSDGTGDVAADPRRQFRGTSVRGNSTYTRLADGRWMEQNSNFGTLYYRERQRTPAMIELMPIAPQGQAVRLALGWCVSLNPSPQGGAEVVEVYSDGAWDIEKLGRSLTPRLAVNLPTPRTVGSTVGGSSTTRPVGTQPATALPGFAVNNITTLRSNERIYALWQNSGWYPATVLSVLGADIRIRYDDNVLESTTVERVRLMALSSEVATNPPQPAGNPAPFNPSQPMPNSPPPSDQAKKLWRHAGGFIEFVDGTWKELSPSGDYFTLSVIGQGADLMEVERLEAPGVRLRFYDNRCEYAISPYTQYFEACKGNWVAPIEEVEMDAPQQNALKKTCDLYAELLGKARKGMSDRFETAMSSNRKRVGKAEERLAVVALLEAEQARFEKEGLVPWSTPMKTATADYLTAVNRARIASEASFDKAIDYFVHHEQPNVAHAVLVLKQKTLAPLLVARLIPREPPRDPDLGAPGFGGMQRPPAPIPAGLPPEVVDQIMRDRARQGLSFGMPSRTMPHRLWSNGQLNDVIGPSKWLADNTGIMLNFVRPTSNTRERVTISERGDEFAAQTTNSISYNGTLASSLEPQERRPEVKFNPKIKAPASDPAKPAAALEAVLPGGPPPPPPPPAVVP